MKISNTKLLLLLCLFLPQLLMAAGTPTLSTPANNSTGYMPNTSFFWNAVSGSVTYQIQIATDAGFSSIVAGREGLPIPRYVPVDALPFSTLYWRVRARDAAGYGSWSATFQYTLSIPPNVYHIASGASAASIANTITSATKPALIVFPASENFTFYPTGTAKFLFDLSSLENLVIDGNNSNITIANRADVGFLRIQQSSKICIKRLTVDWNPLPHTLLDVIKVDTSEANTLNITVRLRKKSAATGDYYPEITNNPGFTDYWSWAYLLDKDNRGAVKRITSSSFGLQPSDVIKQVCSDPPTYNIYRKNSSSGRFFATGDILTIVCRNNVGSFASTTSCTDITFDSITNYSSPIGCYYSYDGSDMKVLNCQAALKDSFRYVSANADGVHCRANPIGPWVERCSFIGNSDDGVALYNKGTSVKSKTNDTTLIVNNEFNNLKAGDNFTIYIPKLGIIPDTSFIVKTVTNNGNGTSTIRFSPAIPTAFYNSMTDLGNTDLQQNVQLYNNSRRNAMFMVHDSRFTVRGRGAIIRAFNGVVSNTKFYNCSSPGILLYNEAAQWYNGLYNEQLSINDNDIRDCGYDGYGENAGAIDVRFNKIRFSGSVYEDSISPIMPNKRIHIRNNSIKNAAKHGITLFNTVTGLIEDNIFTSTIPGFFYSGNHYGVYLNTTDSCIIRGNNFSGDTRPFTSLYYKVNTTNDSYTP
ncbi:right-handed parallel beta-helix repeat-containing protein [Filimonas effusa]|uniref:Right-handed parallel beta-helix repeat-containing protein n=1 Tax=Filimonas effusa TaxID=2508721 RepID=A0A4Q1CZX0_9BACT|nr:right-handed parallel beta-helix repeat-containing protein [Filimonas effusa]RXK80967.1 right-handed parallel beta-helix repeat-containing protein [Filimonas effusa]